MAKRELLIGSGVAPAAERVTLDADALTTHGVVLGMTGSGKTGLAIVVLEELARHGVPLLVCDLKGDLTNLLLTFPELRPEDFAPYLPASIAGAGRSTAAAEVAGTWRDGLAPWSLGATEIRAVRERLDWQLLTPGSGLAPVDILPALGRPTAWDPELDPDSARGRLNGTAAGLLALVGRGGDPLTDRDHVLVASLLDHAWRQGSDLDLARLIAWLDEPPLARFGVLDAESFYPRRERAELVRAFNVVLASPAFAVWTRGEPLDIGRLIGAGGVPRGTILYLAHLGDRERASFLTLLFSGLLGWARSQPGAESLRVLLYLDEVQGILPPSALPPTKPPLLTLLKQGRAFGAGVLLATQNPVDLDYKALGNMGVKLVGRLDTENDRRRALEGLDLAGDAERIVKTLDKRQFLFAGARVGTPRVIASRWAMSYLRGPLTLTELKPLVRGRAAAAPASTPSPISVIPGVEQLFAAGGRLEPAVLVDAEVIYRKASPAVLRTVAGRWWAPLRAGRIGWEALQPLGDTEFLDAPPRGSELAPLPGGAAGLVQGAGKAFAAEIDSRALELAWHRGLKLVQEEGESAEAFAARCTAAAGDSKAVTALRAKYETRLRRLDEKLAKEQLELEHDRTDLAAREQQRTLTVASGVGEALLGSLIGARRRGLGGVLRKGASTAKQYSEKQRMTERAKATVEESQQAIETLRAERARLEAELAGELQRLQRESAGGTVEVLRLTPARRDITVRRVALAWLPGEDGE